MSFYTYNAFGSTPTVTCKSGHDATRGATSLSLVDFEKLGGDADMAGDPSALSGGLAAQAAQSGGAPALSAQAANSAAQGAQPDGAPALLAQAGGDAEPTWVDSGTETVEVEEGVSIEAAYKDGVLSLNMPKKVETVPPSRRLEIQ